MKKIMKSIHKGIKNSGRQVVTKSMYVYNILSEYPKAAYIMFVHGIYHPVKHSRFMETLEEAASMEGISEIELDKIISEIRMSRRT